MSSLNKNISFFVFLLLFFSVKGCITMPKLELHDPYFDYIMAVQQEAVKTKVIIPAIAPITIYPYSSAEIINYNQSVSGNLIFVTKYIWTYQEDLENLKLVCSKCVDNTYIETLQDGREVSYSLSKNTQSYTIEIRIKDGN